MDQESKPDGKGGSICDLNCGTMLYQGEEYQILMMEHMEWRGEYVVKGYQLISALNPIPYHGGMVIGRKLRNTYRFTEVYPCYCYAEVLELIFTDGRLTTTVDHSRDMYRVRMNIDKGLRSLDNPRDAVCIEKFLRHAFIRRYFRRRWWALKKGRMK